VFVPQAYAQGMHPSSDTTLDISDSVRQEHLVHVSPHRIIFDDANRRATLTLQNLGAQTTQAEVQVVFAYTTAPHGLPADTILVTPAWQQISPYDTIVTNPKPTDRFAGRWLSGVPTHVTLAPHATHTVTIELHPPSSLPDGTYWARLLTIVRPPTRQHPDAKSKDVRTIYKVPIKGMQPPTLRDSALIFYRHGHVTMGVAMGKGAAQATPPELQSTIGAAIPSLWFRVPLRLTGNSPFEGILHATLHNLATGTNTVGEPVTFMLYHDQIFHWWAWNVHNSPGKYLFILRLDSPQTDVPAKFRIPVTPVADTIPVEIPE
jgi:hypothetical protein